MKNSKYSYYPAHSTRMILKQEKYSKRAAKEIAKRIKSGERLTKEEIEIEFMHTVKSAYLEKHYDRVFSDESIKTILRVILRNYQYELHQIASGYKCRKFVRVVDNNKIKCSGSQPYVKFEDIVERNKHLKKCRSGGAFCSLKMNGRNY